MSEAALSIGLDHERDFRRWVAISAALHVALFFAAMVVIPPPDREPPMGDPDVTIVTPQELAAMLAPQRPAAAKPKPAQPEPEAAPEPEPEPEPEPAEIIIPEDTHRPPPKPKAKPEVQVDRTDAKPKPRSETQEQVSLEDLLFEARVEAGSMPQGEVRKAALPQPGGGGTGDPVSPEIAAWQAKVRAHVRRHMGLPPGFRGKSLKTRVVVTLTSSGDILDYEIDRSSGNPWFDEQVEQYLADETSLPAPPDSGDWPLIIDGDL